MVAPTSRTLTVCNASGARPVAVTFTYTYSAVASAGGTQTFNIAVGACAPRVFYTQGVTVTENVPAGYAVTGIALTPTPGGPGTASVISANTPSAGSATVTIGSGQIVYSQSPPRGTVLAPNAPVNLTVSLGHRT
ncbi:MAG: hypothetical protein ACHQDE_03735 [Acidimicrobiia bacterium]